MIGRFDLTDWEWSIIEPLLPGCAGKKARGRPRKDDRRVLNGIFFILRTGASWRDLPERYGPYTTAYNRFNRWAKRGVWGRNTKIKSVFSHRCPFGECSTALARWGPH